MDVKHSSVLQTLCMLNFNALCHLSFQGFLIDHESNYYIEHYHCSPVPVQEGWGKGLKKKAYQSPYYMEQFSDLTMKGHVLLFQQPPQLLAAAHQAAKYGKIMLLVMPDRASVF